MFTYLLYVVSMLSFMFAAADVRPSREFWICVGLFAWVSTSALAHGHMLDRRRLERREHERSIIE